MDKHELTGIKCRMGAIGPRKMQDIRACSEAAYKLITSDLPTLIKEIEALLARPTPVCTIIDMDESGVDTYS